MERKERNNKVVEFLASKGIEGSFWQKENFDRFYIGFETLLSILNVKVEFYNTGRVKEAYVNGEKVSNSTGSGYVYTLKTLKVYYDFNSCTLEIKGESSLNEEILNNLNTVFVELTQLLTETPEEAPEEEAEATGEIILTNEIIYNSLLKMNKKGIEEALQELTQYKSYYKTPISEYVSKYFNCNSRPEEAFLTIKYSIGKNGLYVGEYKGFEPVFNDNFCSYILCYVSEEEFEFIDKFWEG